MFGGLFQPRPLRWSIPSRKSGVPSQRGWVRIPEKRAPKKWVDPIPKQGLGGCLMWTLNVGCSDWTWMTSEPFETFMTWNRFKQAFECWSKHLKLVTSNFPGISPFECWWVVHFQRFSAQVVSGCKCWKGYFGTISAKVGRSLGSESGGFPSRYPTNSLDDFNDGRSCWMMTGWVFNDG